MTLVTCFCALGTQKLKTDKIIVLEHSYAQSLEIGEVITMMNRGNATVRDISRTQTRGTANSGAGTTNDQDQRSDPPSVVKSLVL
ncbi:hypothetical protein F5Y09DRAFT_318003 [Xylaria sp. FL1042]|nr:hypothetical protein F5Y09DRAFT_318003 [Xylaria sp. FL1042]